jgi:hypothetical protein
MALHRSPNLQLKARIKHTAPAPSRHPHQRQLALPDYLYRVLPAWRNPEWLEASAWRAAVQQQPVAVTCRETLISNMVSLDWKIEPRESDQRDELKEDIDYYTKFFEYTGDYDYQELLEWVLKDALDLPFGGAVELGWENDTPPSETSNSKLLWIEPLDGGTLYPTLDTDYPVGQILREYITSEVYFPKYAISRVYCSPKTDIRRKGWGMAPPEQIFLALQLINRGDLYYANLLLDTPEVGILDLGDIDAVSAKQWVESWQNLLRGVDPFKIPVLYEHEKPAQFISFTRSPTEITFNNTILHYTALVTSGYGMSLSDIGMQVSSSGGETLAGSIRQERRTRKTGFARIKNKTRLFWNRMLPPSLEWKYTDIDDELAVALGRARLATATALGLIADKGMISPQEGRLQLISDGLMDISMPEELPEDAKPVFERQFENSPFGGGQSQERPGLLGKPIAPSQGGYGESKAELYDRLMDEVPEFRSTMEDLEQVFPTLDLNAKSEVTEQVNALLDAILVDT